MFQNFIDKIKAKEPFSFSRWGDGEWSAIFQTRPETHGNVDGHLFYKDMGEELARIVKSRPKYYLGMQRFAREETHPQLIESFLIENNLQDYPWINADVWHHASIKGYFEEFFEALKERSVIFVAPEYLCKIDKFSFMHIRVPEQNCWLHRKEILEEVTRTLDLYDAAGAADQVVLFCASMPTKYIIDELYKEFGDRHTLLDLGSVFDPYVGKASRSYHKKIIEKLKG